MKAMFHRTLLFLLLAGLWTGGASAQLLVNERMFLQPTRVVFGPGTVRLDGMGGFEAAVADENYEIDAYDFSRNPAGLGDDRDSWSIDTRYGHQEFVERDAASNRDNLRVNEGSFLVAYHAPGKMGLGGRIDYAEAHASDASLQGNSYEISGLELVGSRYFFPRFSAGLRLSLTSEAEDTFSPRVYNISHESTLIHAGLGGTYRVMRGVVVGARGEIVSSQIDGTSRGPFHTDSFDWSRPGGLVSVHGFVDRGRVQAGVDWSRQEIEGEESVAVSWSQRFVYNPTDEVARFDTDTFTEDRTDDAFRARVRLMVIPKLLTLSGAVMSARQEFTVVENPNIIGSRAEQEVEAEGTAIVLGASTTQLRSRLLLAAEVKVASSEVTGLAGGPMAELDEKVVRLGGEYLAGEILVGRLGFARTLSTEKTGETPEVEASERDLNRSTLSTGLGVVPSGGIWQFDLAYDLDLRADTDNDRSRFSAYVKYLF